MRKIVFGGMWCDLPDWEIYTEADHDISKPLNFEDNSIDFIFTEHVVEHLELPDAIGYFKECKRILKPGGILRTVMPFIDRLVDPNNDLMGEHGAEYLKNNIIRLFADDKEVLGKINIDVYDIRKTLQINGLFYRCGHKFIWSSKLLTKILIATGFAEVHEWEAGHGLIPKNCVEHRQRGINMSMDADEEKTLPGIDYEGFAIEGVK